MFKFFHLSRRALEDKQSIIAVGETAHTSDDITLDDLDIVPHFQRVSISGEDTSGVPLEDFEHASSLLIKALELRERYMSISFQSFPQTTERFLKSVHNKKMSDNVEYEDKRTTAGKSNELVHLVLFFFFFFSFKCFFSLVLLAFDVHGNCVDFCFSFFLPIFCEQKKKQNNFFFIIFYYNFIRDEIFG